jgi:hypothetical protein
VNNILDVEMPPEFNFGANMATGSLLHQPRADIF